MERSDKPDTRISLKRKSPECDDDPLSNSFSLDDLPEDLFERVLSRLPTSTFFHLISVSKRWRSVAFSASFKLACSLVPSRNPWFLMVSPNLNQSVIYESAENSWKRLNYPNLLLEDSNRSCMPVASSGGLICYRKLSGDFIVCNPLTKSCKDLPPLHITPQNQSLNAIVMSATFTSYKIVLIHGELPNLSFMVYDSNSVSGCWKDETALRKKVDDSFPESDSTHDNVAYFVSKAGYVVASGMQLERSPFKQYSSIITNKDGQEVVYFLSSFGTIVACNLTNKCFSEYPRLLPVFCEYSIDVVECNGEMLVVVLSESLESESLRVWKYDEANQHWHQIAAMPPAMSNEWYGKKADINCVGAGGRIFICLNSSDLYTYVLYDLASKTWVELPRCSINGEIMEFKSAFSFEPRIEASV
ncbi:F-box only protein 13-like [Neltuma alba]|uniref:F-box only protein 13-like n=1 Tax=Neltuma alba TaxID=207710 RepID=UPI0010A40565|nr:F-box only protein 13-like [Prosopis alba]XP_028807095.1 F-box only protein 13-like [Prosopis alba]